MADLRDDVYVAYLRGFAKARSGAVITEGDFGTKSSGHDLPTPFTTASLYAAFAFGIEEGKEKASARDRADVEAAVKKMVGG